MTANRTSGAARPSLAEVRAVAQPPGHIARRNGEHWAGRWYMRRLSIRATWAFVDTPVTPNQLTGVMTVVGVLGGVALAFPGLWTAVLAALLIQLYLLLDCSDGELARWRRTTSVTGVYLDRVGAYFAEAAVLAGLGFRAQDGLAGGWAVLGLAGALGAILIKAETDLVDVARAKSGLDPVQDSASVPRSGLLATLRRVVGATKFHRIVQRIDLALLALAAEVADAVRGADLTATRLLTAAAAVVAGVQLVLHLVSILASRRLR